MCNRLQCSVFEVMSNGEWRAQHLRRSNNFLRQRYLPLLELPSFSNKVLYSYEYLLIKYITALLQHNNLEAYKTLYRQ